MSSADTTSGDPPATDAEAAVTEEAPPAERPYTAADLYGLNASGLHKLVERQLSLWPYKSGKDKWHPSRKPNMDVIKKVLLSDAGFTTTKRVPSPPLVISKSHAPSQRTTTSHKEDAVAQAAKDGKITDTVVVAEARKIGLQPALPPTTDSTTAPPEQAKTPDIGETELATSSDDLDGGAASAADSSAATRAATRAVPAAAGGAVLAAKAVPAAGAASAGTEGERSDTVDFSAALPAALFNHGGVGGDVSQNLLPGSWAEGSEGMPQIVDVFVCDLRNGEEKSHRQVQVRLASDRHSLYSVRSRELLMAIQGSADPIAGSGNVTAAVAASDILTVVAVVQDSELSEGGHPTVPVQFDVLTNSFSVGLTVKARMGIKRADPPSPSRVDVRDGSNPETIAAKRPKKSKKLAESADAPDASSELSDKDKVARWLRAQLEKDPKWKDYDVNWGAIARQDKEIFREAVWIKNLTATWVNKFAMPEDTGSKRAHKLKKADVERAFGKSHTWLGNKERLARYGEYFGKDGPGEDDAVVERLASIRPVPGGESKLLDFLAGINAANGKPCNS